MAGILPNTGDGGGIVVRTMAGVPTNALGAVNAFIPPANFVMDCPMTALSNDPCVAKYSPAQINTLVSEFIAFASTLTPDGVWACGAVDNVAHAFTAWRDGTAAGTLRDIIAKVLVEGYDGGTYAGEPAG